MACYNSHMAYIGGRQAMKALASTVDLVRSKPSQEIIIGETRLIEIGSRSVPFSSIAHLSEKLSVSPATLLNVIGISDRTSNRRRQEGFLKQDEADRLLRVARIFEEASRVFGSEAKAARWLNTTSPVLYNSTPLSLLESDAGTQAVSEELVHIDFGDFA